MQISFYAKRDIVRKTWIKKELSNVYDSTTHEWSSEHQNTFPNQRMFAKTKIIKMVESWSDKHSIGNLLGRVRNAWPVFLFQRALSSLALLETPLVFC